MMPRLKQSWLAQLAALEQKQANARETHYTFLFEHQSFKAWRDGLIASGKARHGDKFVYFYWKSPEEPPPTDGGAGPAP
jgi:hypothetical protein